MSAHSMRSRGLKVLAGTAAIMVATATAAHAEPPSGRDNVTVGGHVGIGGGYSLSISMNVDDYQRNSSAITGDATGYIDYVVLASDLPIRDYDSQWATYVDDETVSAHGWDWAPELLLPIAR